MNSFGRLFRVSIFGESHGSSVGIVVDGCPPGISLAEKDFEIDLSRRRPGAAGTTSRKESDVPVIKSGVFNGYTTGTPILIEFINSDTVSKDYAEFVDVPRPGHADFTARIKYSGFNDYRGGGHFSGRLTAGLVAAGVIARRIIPRVKIIASLLEAGGSTDIEMAVDDALREKDSIGGLVKCHVTGMNTGWGEPFFDSLESLISHVVFSIPAVKGIEFGSGFASASLKGSEHNDMILDPEGRTETNRAGGINGGISNGNELFFRVAVKPTPSIGRIQKTCNLKSGRMEELEIKGRHDACIALRIPVVIESAAAIVLADAFLIDSAVRRREADVL